MRETTGSAAAVAARCRNCRRGRFILNLPLSLHVTRSPRRRGRASAGEASDLALATSHLAQSPSASRVTRAQAGSFILSQSDKPAHAWALLRRVGRLDQLLGRLTQQLTKDQYPVLLEYAKHSF